MWLLLLPGMDGTGELFGPLRAALPPSLPAVAVSYPREQPLGYAELLPIVEAKADGLGDFVVVGESFSGPLALMLAARCPAGLRGVVLCASFARFPLPVPARWRGIVRPWMFRIQPKYLMSAVLLGRHGFGPLGRLLRQAVQSVSSTVLAARARAVSEVDVTAELRDCPVPILDLRASKDWLVGNRCQTLIHSVRSDVEAVVLPGPHLILQVCPEQAAKVLEEFCHQRIAALCAPEARAAGRRAGQWAGESPSQPI